MMRFFIADLMLEQEWTAVTLYSAHLLIVWLNSGWERRHSGRMKSEGQKCGKTTPPTPHDCASTMIHPGPSAVGSTLLDLASKKQKRVKPNEGGVRNWIRQGGRWVTGLLRLKSAPPLSRLLWSSCPDLIRRLWLKRHRLHQSCAALPVL